MAGSPPPQNMHLCACGVLIEIRPMPAHEADLAWQRTGGSELVRCARCIGQPVHGLIWRAYHGARRCGIEREKNSAAVPVKKLAIEGGQPVAGFLGIGEHGIHPRCPSLDRGDAVNGVASGEECQRARLAIHGQDSITGAG